MVRRLENQVSGIGLDGGRAPSVGTHWNPFQDSGNSSPALPASRESSKHPSAVVVSTSFLLPCLCEGWGEGDTGIWMDRGARERGERGGGGERERERGGGERENEI
jgi:hypothetical protein